jgi:hypothetical protein
LLIFILQGVLTVEVPENSHEVSTAVGSEELSVDLLPPADAGVSSAEDASGIADSGNVGVDVDDGITAPTGSHNIAADAKTNDELHVANELVDVDADQRTDPDSQPDTDEDSPPGLSGDRAGPGPGPLKPELSLASTVFDDDSVSEKGVADMIANGAPGSPDTVPDVQPDSHFAVLDDFSSNATPETSTIAVSAHASTGFGDISFASVSVSTRVDSNVSLPSPNRLSISYDDGNRRLIINADVVEAVKVYRAENRIEVAINLQQTDAGDLKGILVSLTSASMLSRPLTSCCR